MRRLEEILANAEPYPPGSPEIESYDGKYDPNRLAATMAKDLLAKDDRSMYYNTDT